MPTISALFSSMFVTFAGLWENLESLHLFAIMVGPSCKGRQLEITFEPIPDLLHCRYCTKHLQICLDAQLLVTTTHFLVLSQITRNGNDLWLSYWVSNLDSPHDHHHPQIPASTTYNSTSTHLHSLWHDPSSLAPSQSWLQPNSFCYSSLPTYTQYTSLGGSMLCHTQMNPVFPTNANATSSLQTAPQAAISQSVSLSRHLLAELSRKQPVLDPDTKFYLVVLLCIAAANSVFTFVRAFSFAYGGLVAARKLHEQLLTAVISAPAKFFQTTLPGTHIRMIDAHPAVSYLWCVWLNSLLNLLLLLLNLSHY